jgi:hypothetical protein
MRRLEAEQERWFLWVPVFRYRLLVLAPLVTGLAALAAMLALLPAAPRRVGVTLARTGLTVAGAGFARAKLGVEWVGAPVLARQMS